MIKSIAPLIGLSLLTLAACKTTAPAGDTTTAKVDIPVTDFTSCLVATGEVMESYPRQCAYGGETFVEDIAPSGKGTTTTLYFEVAANTQTCTGMIEQQCLVVNGQYFYDTIDGYTHTEGTPRILKVERTQYCDPEIINDCPQDVGIYRYKLVRIIG